MSLTRLTSRSPSPRSTATCSTSSQNGSSGSSSRLAGRLGDERLDLVLGQRSCRRSAGAPPASRRTRVALDPRRLDGGGRLPGEDGEQLHVPQREARRAALVEDLEDADRPFVVEEGHRRDRARDVAGLLGGLAVEARIRGDVGHRQRLAGGEDESGDPLAGLHRPGRSRRRRGHRQRPGISSRSGSVSKRAIEEASASKRLAVASTIDCRRRCSTSPCRLRATEDRRPTARRAVSAAVRSSSAIKSVRQDSGW